LSAKVILFSDTAKQFVTFLFIFLIFSAKKQFFQRISIRKSLVSATFIRFFPLQLAVLQLAVLQLLFCCLCFAASVLLLMFCCLCFAASVLLLLFLLFTA